MRAFWNATMLGGVIGALVLATNATAQTQMRALGGFSNQDDENGFHLSVKRWLLRHEGATASPWQQQSIWD